MKKINHSATDKKIVVVGIGGAGVNIVEYMSRKDVKLKLIAISTDAQHLPKTREVEKILIGAKFTQGFSSCMNPCVGRCAALESYEEIKSILRGAETIFIVAGFGAGTGTGATPIVARIANEVGALAIPIVTKPFSFEGESRFKIAENGIQELRREVDSMLIISNDKLLPMINNKLGMKDSFELVDSIFLEIILSVSEALLSDIEDDIDLKIIMGCKGLAVIGVSEGVGENAAYESMKSALKFPFFDEIKFDYAMSVWVHFKVHPNFSLMETFEATNLIHESMNEEGEIMFSISIDKSFSVDQVKVIILATDFGNILNKTIMNIQYD